MDTQPLHIFIDLLVDQIRWYGLELISGLALWFSLRRYLPEPLAWGLSRVTGGYLAAWLALFPAVFLGSVAFNAGSYSASILAIALVGLSLKFWGGLFGKKILTKSLEQTETKNEILKFELATGVVRLLLLIVNAGGNALQVSDRMRDASFLTAIMTQLHYPVSDPWYAGHAIPYYLFSYYPLAGIAMQAGETALTAYPLALVSVATQYFSALYLLLRTQSFSFFSAFVGALTIVWGADLKIVISFLKKIAFGMEEKLHRVGDHTLVQLPFDFYLGGYVHPCFNAMALFATLLVITKIYLKTPSKNASHVAVTTYALISAWLTAIVWGSNSWEVPIFFVLFSIAIWLHESPQNKTYAVGFILLGGFCTYIFSSPFRIIPYSSKFEFDWITEPIFTTEFLETYGLFLLPILIGFWVRYLQPMNWIDYLLFALCGSTLILNNSVYFLVALLCLAIRGYFRDSTQDLKYDSLLFVAGLGIILGYSLMSLKGDRFNTILKFVLPSWTLLGCAAMVSLRDLQRKVSQWAWLVIALLFLIPVNFWGVRSLRSSFILFDYIQPRDGLSLIGAQYPNDAALLRWVQNHLSKHEQGTRIIESPGSVYRDYHTRFSTVTGLSCYVCSAGTLHYRHYDPKEAMRRYQIVTALYSGTLFDEKKECGAVKDTLRKESIGYVVVGDLERTEYPGSGIARLSECLGSRYQVGSASLLRVD